MAAELLQSIWDNPDFRYFIPLGDHMLVNLDILMMCVLFSSLDCKPLVGTTSFLTFVLG